MNPHMRLPITPAALLASLSSHRELLSQLVRREVAARYRGSALGLLWLVLTPLLLLAMYTFVFSVVFNARWGDGPGPQDRLAFAQFVFVGMLLHGLLAEVLVRAPTLVLSNVSYVKKVVFPLEVLPLVAVATAAFNALAGFAVLGLALALGQGGPAWTWLWLPVVVLPLLALASGAAWFLSSLGVYVRDIAHPIGLVATLLLFASPVFYPSASVPAPFADWLALNPLGFAIEQARAVVLLGRGPDWRPLALHGVAGLLAAWAGYAWFQRTRRGFANVL